MTLLLALSVLFAQEPSTQSNNILFHTPPTKEQSLLLHGALQKYLKESKEIFIGELRDVRPMRSTFGFDNMALFEVHSWLRGSEESLTVERSLPYRAPYAFGNPMSIRPVLIKGYKLLVFVDKYGAIVDGNALFVVVDGHVFRNKTPEVFLNPKYDRVWNFGNPHDDYLIYSLYDIEASVRRNMPVIKKN